MCRLLCSLCVFELPCRILVLAGRGDAKKSGFCLAFSNKLPTFVPGKRKQEASGK